jgi:hypothetical protein
MSPETKALLCRFDEPGAYEFPASFDYLDLERRAQMVCKDMERFVLHVGFEGAVYNQDASFSIAILLHDYERNEPNGLYQPTIRFSNFGNLATMTWIDLIPEPTRKEICASLDRNGFTYVCADELDCEYDGIMPEKERAFPTWWIRYFDWL